MRGLMLAVGLLSAVAAPALAQPGKLWPSEVRWGGKLLLTGGVSAVEGAGGGGLSTWATTSGYGDDDGIGGNLHGTVVNLRDFQLTTYGGAVSLFDRLELSYAHQKFDTQKAGAALGLGKGFAFNQDVYGAKWVVAGDAVYDQDRLLPQVAVGVQHHRNDKGGVIAFVGGEHDKGTDYYVAATKLLLDKSLLLNATVRLTDANQFGLLGYGGAAGKKAPQFEGSVAWLASKRLALGAEYRTKPDNLGFAREQDAFDLFAAFALNKNLSVTAAYVDLGDIATFRNQRGAYLSLQAGF
jgi:hypothetical protein